MTKTKNIGESTVKLHMTALLKKYAVKTRSQLAVFSTNNVKVELPDSLEELPFAWVHQHGGVVVGIIFKSKKPKDGWEPLYLKRKE